MSLGSHIMTANSQSVVLEVPILVVGLSDTCQTVIGHVG